MKNKVCSRCKQSKPYTAFSTDNSRLDGKQPQCKQCRKEQAALYRSKHRERIRKDAAEFRSGNKSKIREYNQRYRDKYPEKEAVRHSVYYSANKLKISEYHAARYKRKKSHIDAVIAKYALQNRGKIAAKSAKYRCRKANATPPWYEADKVAEIYAAAAKLREQGSDVHVDHSIPIAGVYACGLHCASNLQIMPATDNVRKSNKFIPYSTYPIRG